MNIVIDIETRPRDTTPEEREAIALASKKNPNRKPNTRAEWAAVPENQARACEALALDISQCRIVVVSVAVGDLPVWSVSSWDDEAYLLMALWRMLDSCAVERPGEWVYVGQSITGFDLPILRRACMRHAYQMPCRLLYRSIPTRKYSDCIHDNMLRAAAPGNAYVSAQVLAQSIGVLDKGAQAVVDFPALWAKGAACLPELVARCEADVRSERAVFERHRLMWADKPESDGEPRDLFTALGPHPEIERRRRAALTSHAREDD